MTRLLSEGTTGADVLAMQSKLNRSVPRVSPVKEDGIFGPKTKASVLAFQAAHSLKADGIFGPVTSALLAANHVIDRAGVGKSLAVLAWSATRQPGHRR